MKEQKPRRNKREFYTKGRNYKGLGRYREQMPKTSWNGKKRNCFNKAKPFIK